MAEQLPFFLEELQLQLITSLPKLSDLLPVDIFVHQALGILLMEGLLSQQGLAEAKEEWQPTTTTLLDQQLAGVT